MLSLQNSQKSNNKSFKEKGSIDVTPYLDKSDGGTGYSPPLLHNTPLLITILTTLIVLFLVIAKLRVVLRNNSSSENELPISESTPISNSSNQYQATQKVSLEKNRKNRSLFSKFRRLALKLTFGKTKAAQNRSLMDESGLKQIKTRGDDEKD
ncbi:hypothetical protein [Aerosakkonema funiforme]|uniref:hypothetical protein n=1 Tax=Aerosakkonema funiforme TaxID=1246630 RepID=UPI0035BB1A46